MSFGDWVLAGVGAKLGAALPGLALLAALFLGIAGIGLWSYLRR